MTGRGEVLTSALQATGTVTDVLFPFFFLHGISTTSYY